MVRFEGWGGRWGQALRLTELGGDGMLAETRLGSKKKQNNVPSRKTKQR